MKLFLGRLFREITDDIMSDLLMGLCFAVPETHIVSAVKHNQRTLDEIQGDNQEHHWGVYFSTGYAYFYTAVELGM